MTHEESDFELDKEGLDDSVVEEEHSADKVRKLKEKLKESEAKAREYLDGWQRERAEIANARKRDEEAKKDFLKFANAGLIEELVPVLDSLNLSGGHAEAIYRQMLQVLKQHGLEEDNPLGEAFDPRRHEAIGTREGEENKILEVAQKGYILSGKIIRPAKVIIGQ